MKRLSDTPVWLRLTAAIWLLLIIVWASFIAWETRVSRDIAIDQSQLFANTINDMTMAGLTGMMINGTIANRAVFLDQIERLDALRELRVLRGDAVSSAFGRPEGELAPDAVEARVLASGEAYRAVEASAEGGQHLRVILPTLASDNYLGKNCLMCHQVTAGTPLGAVSMRIALDRVDASVSQFRNASAIFALVASLPVVLIVFFFVRRVVTRPLERMSEGLRDLARGEGDLTRRLAVAGNDEIGQTGLRFNEMLATIAQLVREVGRLLLSQLAESGVCRLAPARGGLTVPNKKDIHGATQRLAVGQQLLTALFTEHFQVGAIVEIRQRHPVTAVEQLCHRAVEYRFIKLVGLFTTQPQHLGDKGGQRSA